MPPANIHMRTDMPTLYFFMLLPPYAADGQGREHLPCTLPVCLNWLLDLDIFAKLLIECKLLCNELLCLFCRHRDVLHIQLLQRTLEFV